MVVGALFLILPSPIHCPSLPMPRLLERAGFAWSLCPLGCAGSWFVLGGVLLSGCEFRWGEWVSSGEVLSQFSYGQG